MFVYETSVINRNKFQLRDDRSKLLQVISIETSNTKDNPGITGGLIDGLEYLKPRWQKNVRFIRSLVEMKIFLFIAFLAGI